MIKFVIKLIFYCLCVINLYNVESVVFPNHHMTIVKNHGFLNHLVHPVNFILHKCILKLEDGTTFDLDPTVKEPLIYNTSEGVVIQRFSKELCGVRVKNVVESMSGNWTLISESNRQEVDEDWFMLDVTTNDVDKSPVIVKVTKENPSQRIKCPNYDKARYCRVIDKNGNLIVANNEYDIYVSAKGNETYYDCYTARWGQMDEIKSSIKVVLEEKPSIVKGVITETDTHFILTCEDKYMKRECHVEMPGKSERMLIQEGLLMDHYSSYDTQ